MEEKLKTYGDYIKSILEKETVKDSYSLVIRKSLLENIVFKVNKFSQNILSLEIFNENRILKYFKKPKSLTIYFLNDYLNLKNGNKYYLCYNDDKNQLLCSNYVNFNDHPLQKYLRLDFLVRKIPEIYENAMNYFNRKSLIEMDNAKNKLSDILYSSLRE